MRLSAALFAGIALCAVAGPVRAGEQFDMFQQICMASHASPADVLAAADKTGWMPLPDALKQSLSQVSAIPNPQGRLRSGPTGLMILLAGAGMISDIQNAHGEVCAVMHAPSEAGLDGEVAGLAAVPKDAKDSIDQATYYWRDEKNLHVPVATGDIDVQTALKAGPIHMLMEKTQEKFSVAMSIIASQSN